MINAVLFVLLKCFLYWKGVRIGAHITLAFISMYEKDKDTVAAILVVLTFLVFVGLFFFGIFDVATDVIRMEDLI